jgi:hypothetical protein
MKRSRSLRFFPQFLKGPVDLIEKGGICVRRILDGLGRRITVWETIGWWLYELVVDIAYNL